MKIWLVYLAAGLIGAFVGDTVKACTPFGLTDFSPKIVYEDTGPPIGASSSYGLSLNQVNP